MKLTALVFAFGALAACSSDNGGSSGQPDAGSGSSGVVCGDGVCSATEVTSCSADCGDAPYCGDSTCNNGETASSCCNDCDPGNCNGGGGSGSGSGGGGNGLTCPTDPTACLGCVFDPTGCPAGFTPNDCSNCVFGGGIPGGGGSGSGSGSGSPLDALFCTGGAVDGTCDADEMDLGFCSDCL